MVVLVRIFSKKNFSPESLPSFIIFFIIIHLHFPFFLAAAACLGHSFIEVLMNDFFEVATRVNYFPGLITALPIRKDNDMNPP